MSDMTPAGQLVAGDRIFVKRVGGIWSPCYRRDDPAGEWMTVWQVVGIHVQLTDGETVDCRHGAFRNPQ